MTESQKSSESSSAADKADTAGNNSDKFWITGFKGSDPSDTLPQDIFGSKISVPVDLSAIDGGNANMKMYGDDIGRSSDIMSVDKMIGENSDVEITFVSWLTFSRKTAGALPYLWKKLWIPPTGSMKATATTAIKKILIK